MMSGGQQAMSGNVDGRGGNADADMRDDTHAYIDFPAGNDPEETKMNK
jgi:hypothetical protein